MRVKTVTSLATATSLLELLGIQDVERGTVNILLQTAAGVTWGGKNNQSMIIQNDLVLPGASLKDVYLLGAGAVNVAWW